MGMGCWEPGKPPRHRHATCNRGQKVSVHLLVNTGILIAGILNVLSAEGVRKGALRYDIF